MQKSFDYLIVGAGLFGAVAARELTDHGYRCLVIDQRSHIGGNCYTEKQEGITIHKYGPHIFHTNDKKIWDYVQKYTNFYPYQHTVKVSYRDKVYSFPLNLMTLYQLWGVSTPEEAKKKLLSVCENYSKPKNLEEWALSKVGREIYETFIKGYTEKQWGCSPKKLPAFIIKRLPIRLTFEDNYYYDLYQGIPEKGYTALLASLLKGVEVRLNQDYFKDRGAWNSLTEKVIYTGCLDAFYEYCYGNLEYRTLRFETKRFSIESYQGCSVMNFTEAEVPYTRTVEYKHFIPTESDHTFVTWEYPDPLWDRKKIPYYPINTLENNQRALMYRKKAQKEEKVLFGGRLADYKYYDMHQVIASALAKVKKEMKLCLKPGFENKERG